MKRSLPIIAALAVVCLAAALVSAQTAPATDAACASARPTAPAPATQTFNTMMHAIKDGDYQAFISMGTPAVQHAISKTLFETVAAQVNPRERQGFKSVYLGSLRKHGLTLYVWKIEFKTGDDTLAQMTLDNGKVAGFFLA